LRKDRFCGIGDFGGGAEFDSQQGGGEIGW
jgi:hypothetical protein